MALTLLATTYCHAGRMLTRAEGLLREASRLVHFRKHHKDQLTISDGCHVSLAVRIAWQQAQLLAVLPKRDSDAIQWAGLARTLWRNEHFKDGVKTSPHYAMTPTYELDDEEVEDEQAEDTAGGSASERSLKIEQALGDLGSLAGKGHIETRNVMSFWLGRVFYY